jgi:hypothetical protein
MLEGGIAVVVFNDLRASFSITEIPSPARKKMGRLVSYWE